MRKVTWTDGEMIAKVDTHTVECFFYVSSEISQSLKEGKFSDSRQAIALRGATGLGSKAAN